MMIPPLIRLGYPPEPKPNCIGYVCLCRGWGWMILNWTPALGFHQETVLYPGSNGLVDQTIIQPEDILCWMPQDGS